MAWSDEDNSNHCCTPVSGIPHLLPLHWESANCLPKTASSLSIPAGLEQGRPHTSSGAAPSSDENLAQLLEKSGKIPSSQKRMSPVELNVKNQQPILPGKQQVTNRRQNYRENRGVCGETNCNQSKNQALPVAVDEKEKGTGENNSGRLLRYPTGL